MKHTYKLLTTFIILLSLVTFKTAAQNCIQTSQYPSGTIPIAQTGTTTVTGCNFGGEYSVNNFTTIGSYTVTSTGGAGNYLTITDNSNNVLVSGASPLAASIPSVGLYRIHLSTNASCGTDGSCHNVTVARILPPCLQLSQYPSGTIAIAQTGTTTVTGCNFGGEYSVNSFTAAGSYTLNATGGAGNYLTLTDNSNNVVLAGFPPLAVTIPSVGIYRIHVSTGITCGTDGSCHNVSVIGIPPPTVPNDLCSGAIVMSVPSSTAGTTIGATVESPAPLTCGTTLSQPGVWYRVVGNGNRFGADLCAASAWDSKIFVYTGSCGAWTCVTGNDDNGPICSGAAASVTWCSVPSITYFILVTGFSSPSAFTVAVTQTVNPFTPTVVVTAANPSVCLTSSTAITATGAGSYVWNTGATTASISVTPTASTIYTVVGTASVGCATDTKTVSITSLINPTVTLSSNNGSICPGGAFITTANGASTYTFNGSPSGTVVATTATLSPIVNTTYTVVGTGANGCRSLLANSPTATVITLVSPTLVVAASPASVCPGAASNLTVTGANSYTWTAPASNATLVSVNPTITTIYTVSGTGTTVCNGVRTFTLFVFPTPTISVNSGTVCAGSVFTMVPSGASTYTFSGPNTNTVSPATSTLYTVAGTNTITGCISSSLTGAVSNVTVVTLPVVTVSSGTVCNGSQYVMLASGASNYTFVNSSNPVTPTVTSSYTVVGNTPSISACVSLPAISNVTVFNLPTLSVTATPSNMVICNTDPISLTVSGAATYTWNNTFVGATFSATPSSNTSYFAVATDTNGCTNVVTSQVTVNPLPAMGVSSNTNFICNGGSATITAAGASTYSWSNATSSTNIVVTPTVSTVYGVTGTSTLGCSKTLTLTVNVNTITMSVSSNTAICKGNSADLVATGPTSFTWNPANGPFGSIQVTPNVTTTYTVTGKDSKNCFYTSAVTVTVNAIPTISAGSSTSLMCVGETLTLTASGANTYVWSLNSISTGTGSNLVLTPSNSGTNNYITTGTDNNGCVNADTVTVKVDKCTGLSTFNNSNSGVSVYPNPNRGEFTVELNNGLDKTIEVTDVTGRVIASTISNTDKTAINLNAFANGIYYVKIQSNTTVEVIRVIKQ